MYDDPNRVFDFFVYVCHFCTFWKSALIKSPYFFEVLFFYFRSIFQEKTNNNKWKENAHKKEHSSKSPNSKPAIYFCILGHWRIINHANIVSNRVINTTATWWFRKSDLPSRLVSKKNYWRIHNRVTWTFSEYIGDLSLCFDGWIGKIFCVLIWEKSSSK